jgi:hypothetical protein
MPEAPRESKPELIDLVAGRRELVTLKGRVVPIEFRLFRLRALHRDLRRLEGGELAHDLFQLPLADLGEDVELRSGPVAVEAAVFEVERPEQHDSRARRPEERG